MSARLDRAIDAGYEPDPPPDARCECGHTRNRHDPRGCTTCTCSCFWEAS